MRQFGLLFLFLSLGLAALKLFYWEPISIGYTAMIVLVLVLLVLLRKRVSDEHYDELLFVSGVIIFTLLALSMSEYYLLQRSLVE